MREALYRQYRPKEFSQVVGQDHILKSLQSAMEQKMVSHAYLFHGGRGTGKTSIARIFAKELGTKDSDLYEIDAASHTSIENIKELNESIFTLPFESPYKVYILDEVHMLSKSAWNAFLKTLEEPPSYVIFILATTEIEKVPDTILSRCQVFSFKKPTRKILKEVIEGAAKAEGYKLEDGVSELIAIFGDGSFRDAYGTLEKAIGVSKDKEISLSEIEAVTGAPKEEILGEMLDAIAHKKKDKALSVLNKFNEQGIDPILFVDLLLERLRILLLMKINAPGIENLKQDISDFTSERLTALSKDPNSSISSNTLVKLIDTREKMEKSSMSNLILELYLIDLILN
jgi:DNA polymerase III subunit gamma/tau